jgi:hypothetical protein
MAVDLVLSLSFGTVVMSLLSLTQMFISKYLMGPLAMGEANHGTGSRN